MCVCVCVYNIYAYMIEILYLYIYNVIQINARAKYSLSFEGAYPDLYLPKDKDRAVHAETPSEEEILLEQTRRTWILYLPKAHHPLLLQKHRHSLQMAMKDLSNANAVRYVSFIFMSLHTIILQIYMYRT